MTSIVHDGRTKNPITNRLSGSVTSNRAAINSRMATLREAQESARALKLLADHITVAARLATIEKTIPTLASCDILTEI
jgi:hypothetical protein